MNPENLKEFLSKVLLETGSYAVSERFNAKRLAKEDFSVVTDVDLHLSKVIKTEITNFMNENNISSFTIVDEEDEHNFDSYNDAEYAWIIDPIDGTMNFASGVPFWGVSIGLFKNKQPFAGGVYLPSLGELWISDSETVYRQGHNVLEEVKNIQNHYITDYADFAITRTNILEYEIKNTKFKWAIYNCAVANLLYVVNGSHIASIQKVALWDSAAVFSIGKTLGYEVYDEKDKQKIEIFDEKYISSDMRHKNSYIFTKPENINKIQALLNPN